MVQSLPRPIQNVDWFTKIYTGKHIDILNWGFRDSWELDELFTTGDWESKVLRALSNSHFPNNGNTRISYDSQTDSINCKIVTRGVKSQIILRSSDYTWYMRSADVRFENFFLKSAQKSAGLDYSMPLRKAWKAFMDGRICNFNLSNLGDLTKKSNQANIPFKSFLIDHLNLIESSIVGDEKNFTLDFFVGNTRCRLLLSLETSRGIIYKNGGWMPPATIKQAIQLTYNLANSKL